MDTMMLPQTDSEKLLPPPTSPVLLDPPKKSFPWWIIALLVVFIGIAGFLFWQNQTLKKDAAITKELPPVPSPSVETSADPTADWLTYTNTKQGITFKYPKSWELTETPGDVQNGQVVNQNVTLANSPASISMNLSLSGIGGGGVDLEGTPYQLDGHNLYRYTKKMDNGNVLVGLTDELKLSMGVFRVNGKIYSISLVYPATVKSDVYEPTFDQMLSTFRFNNNLSNEIPESVKQVFNTVNKDLGTNLLPTEESKFYSPDGFVTRRSWSIDLTDRVKSKDDITTTQYSLINILASDDSKSTRSGNTYADAYSNKSVDCYFMIHWGASNFLSCSPK
jgi:hypothetical protein